MSLATGMFAVLLVAANITALRHVVGPVEEGVPLDLILSLLPMANALAIVGYRSARIPTAHRSFTSGFLISGLAAMMAHALCDRVFPEAMMRFYYYRPFRAAVTFCRVYRVPGFIAKVPGGGAYFRYYPALTLIFCLPQFLAASFGGAIFNEWSGRSGREVT